MRRHHPAILIGLFSLLLLAGSARVAVAQFPQYRPPSINPMQNTINRPTVSPYLNLTQRNFNGPPTYQTLVRPMVEQRQAAVRQAAQIQQIQQDISSSNRMGASRTTGESQQVRGTGHVSGFMNHMHFFPPMR
ncbi:MAG: hypothetical protein KF708_19965 [Pirellulales bacterium]|nr:hypothetical protein [Pirellulales bacterium]